MAENDIGIRLKAEGEKEFRQTLADINQSFKLLASEMNLVSSQFDKSDKSMEAVTARSQVLNKEIDAQKDKIATLQAALANASESFGENDKRTLNWATQLNNAQAELNGMHRELDADINALSDAAHGFDDAERQADDFTKALDSTGKGLGEAEKDTGDFGKALDDASKELTDTGKETKHLGEEMDETGKKTSVFGELLRANLAADAIKAGLTAVVDMVREIGAAVRSYVSESSQMAAGAAQSQTLLTQVMRNTMDASDDEVTSLVKLAEAQEKLGVVSKTAQVTALAELASFVERREALEDMLPVMNDYVAYQYGTTASEEQARNVATALGKAIQGNIDGLAKQGFTLSQTEKEWFKTATEAERVSFVMEMVSESMGGVNEALAATDAGKMASLNTVLDNTKIAVGTMANEFKARIMGDMLPSVSSLSESFVSLLHGEGSVADMASAFDDVFSEAVGIIDEFLPTVLDLGGDILTAVVTGITGNMDTITTSVGSIIDMLIGTVVELLPMLTEAGTSLLFGLLDGILSVLPSLVGAATQIIASLTKGLGDALPQLIPAVIEAVVLMSQTLIDNLPLIMSTALELILGLTHGILDAIPVLIDALPNIISSMVDFLIGAVPQITDAGVELITSLIGAMPTIVTEIMDAIPLIIDGILTVISSSIPLLVDAGINLLVSLVEALPEIITAIVNAIPAIIESIINVVIGSIPLIIDAGIRLLVSLIDNLPEIIITIIEAVPQIITSIVNVVIENMDKIIDAGVQLFVALVSNLPEIIMGILAAVPAIMSALYESFIESVGKMRELGVSLITGVWEGIMSMGAWLGEKVTGFFGGVVDSVKSFLGINSPSTVFAGIGENMAEGLGIGFAEQMNRVADDMKSTVPTGFDAMSATQQANESLVNGLISGIQLSRSDSLSITINTLLDGRVIARSVVKPLRDELSRLGESV